MVVVVAYFGSRTNLIILPQASQSNFSTCPPLLSCPPSSQYNLLHFPAHRDGEMQCNARHLFYRDTTKVGQRRGGEKELQKSSLASDNEAFCCWATFVVRVDGCYYYTQLTLPSFTTTVLVSWIPRMNMCIDCAVSVMATWNIWLKSSAMNDNICNEILSLDKGYHIQ